MGLAGESGCGKSTLGKSLIRLDARMRYVDGHVELDGKELPIWDDSKMNAFRFKEVSIIPQYALSALNPTRRIGRMATELLASRDVHAGRACCPSSSAASSSSGCSEDVLERFPIELSGGMKQRVVMVLSSLLDPSLLIADEVTSALDVSTQRAVAELLVEFRDRGFVKSMIVITHDLSVLYQIADTILVMYAGKLAEKAPAERDRRLAAAPLHAAAPLVAARGRGPLRGEAAERHSRPSSLAARASGGLPVQGPLPARVREVRRGAAVRRRSRPVAPPRAGRRRLMLKVDTCCKTYRVGAFGGSRAPGRQRRELRRRARARSSRSSARAAAASRPSAR